MLLNTPSFKIFNIYTLPLDLDPKFHLHIKENPKKYRRVHLSSDLSKIINGIIIIIIIIIITIIICNHFSSFE
jgi:hypothetical protein